MDLSRLGLAGLGGLGADNRLREEARMLFEQKQNSHLNHGLGQGQGQHDGLNSKDWQDGLRALLPNVNVSFGTGGGGGGHSNGIGANHSSLSNGPSGGLLGGQGQGLGQHFGLHNNYQGSFSQDRLSQHNSNWGNSIPNGSGLGNDWTMLDPAIVTGQLAQAPPGSLSELPTFPPSRPGPLDTQQHPGNLPGLSRADSPPNWITANLDQLTSEGSSYNGTQQGNLIPAFNGLGLGGTSRGGRGLGGQVPHTGGWGGPTQTPPPGFSHHRQAGGQGYPGFGALNKNNEVPKIGEF